MIATKKSHGWSVGLILNEPVSAHEAALAGLKFRHLQRFIARSSFTQAEVIEAMQLAPATLARRRASQSLTPEESEQLIRLGLLFEGAVELFEGNADSARKWLLSPARALGGAKPWSFARTAFGARMVEDLIGRLEHGVIT